MKQMKPAMFTRPTFRSFAVWASISAAAALGLAGMRAQSTPQAVPSPTTPDSEPTFLQTQDIGNRFTLDTWFMSSDTLVDPTTTANVKAVGVVFEIRYGLASLELIHSLETRTVSDVSTLTFLVGALDVSTAVPSQPPGTPIEYMITMQPKPGYTWYSADSIQRFLIDAVQQ